MLEFKGISAHPGKAKGKICIIRNADEISHCEQDNIALLVGVKPTTSLLHKVKAVLAVYSGITSHSAIVAREKDKPAIVGIQEDILNYIKNGDEVEVDASEGIVYLVK